MGLIRDVASLTLIENPFVIKATPQADLDDAQTKNVMQAVMAQLQQMPMMTSGHAWSKQRQNKVKHLKMQRCKNKQKLSAIAVEMNTLIQDNFMMQIGYVSLVILFITLWCIHSIWKPQRL